MLAHLKKVGCKKYLFDCFCASYPESWAIIEDKSHGLVFTGKELNPIFRPDSLFFLNLELLHCQDKLEASSSTTVGWRNASIVVEILEELEEGCLQLWRGEGVR